MEHHLLLARDLKLLSADTHQDLEKQLQEVQRMLTSLVSSIQEKSGSRPERAEVTKRALAASG
jgi:hypothetical protein